MPRTITRDAVLGATRRVMAAGNFRPTAAEVAQADGFSERSIRQHFGTLDALYREAITGSLATAQAMIALVPMTDEIAFALTLSLGRPS